MCGFARLLLLLLLWLCCVVVVVVVVVDEAGGGVGGVVRCCSVFGVRPSVVSRAGKEEEAEEEITQRTITARAQEHG
jgi:hypothetical protein